MENTANKLSKLDCKIANTYKSLVKLGVNTSINIENNTNILNQTIEENTSILNKKIEDNTSILNETIENNINTLNETIENNINTLNETIENNTTNITNNTTNIMNNSDNINDNTTNIKTNTTSIENINTSLTSLTGSSQFRFRLKENVLMEPRLDDEEFQIIFNNNNTEDNTDLRTNQLNNTNKVEINVDGKALININFKGSICMNYPENLIQQNLPSGIQNESYKFLSTSILNATNTTFNQLSLIPYVGQVFSQFWDDYQEVDPTASLVIRLLGKYPLKSAQTLDKVVIDGPGVIFNTYIQKAVSLNFSDIVDTGAYKYWVEAYWTFDLEETVDRLTNFIISESPIGGFIYLIWKLSNDKEITGDINEDIQCAREFANLLLGRDANGNGLSKNERSICIDKEDIDNLFSNLIPGLTVLVETINNFIMGPINNNLDSIVKKLNPVISAINSALELFPLLDEEITNIGFMNITNIQLPTISPFDLLFKENQLLGDVTNKNNKVEIVIPNYQELITETTGTKCVFLSRESGICNTISADTTLDIFTVKLL